MKGSPLRHLRVLVPVCAIALFGFCIYNSALLEPEPLQQAYVFTLALCVVGIFAFALGRLSLALVIGGFAFFGLKFISVMKLRYLESPLMPADFIYFARDSLVETLEHYPNLLYLAIGVCIAAPLLFWLIWRLDYRPFDRLRAWTSAFVRTIGVLACTGFLWLCLLPIGPFAPLYKSGLWNTLSDNAHLTNFFDTIHNMRPKLPPMTDDAVAEKNWASTAKGLPAPSDAPKTHPDIIQVLEESTFDPAGYTDCTIPQCHVKMFAPDKYTRAHGLLRTHTFGGGTWVSEFSVISGMPQDIFGEAGMYAPFVLAPRLHDSLPMYLRSLGYLTIAVYPAGGNFINARNAYASYGFDKFYDVNDLGLEMWHTSDAQMFAATKKVYDENRKSGKPIFIMVLTLEQHGPHDTTTLSQLPPPFNQGLLPGLSAQKQLNMSAYLARLQDSDNGMSQLEQDFLHRPEPTVIMHFGDHLPSFGGLIRDMPRSLPKDLQSYRNNLTYFMIKSNFSGPALPEYPMVDIAYLPGMVLQAADLPENPYFSALTTMEARCSGLYEDCPDKTLLNSYYAWTFRHLRVYQ